MTLSLQSAFTGPGTGDQSSALVYKLSDDDEVTTCMIINTCEYCAETIKQLEESIKRLIDEDVGKTVDMTSNQEDFQKVLTKAVRILVGGLETKMELPLSNMIKMPWITWDSVGDQSEYVNIINFNINETVPIYREWLSPLYFRFFCDKFANAFIPKFISAIYKCKRISQVGASQLLLDAQAIKKCLLELPNVKLQNATAISSSYTKFVNQEMKKAEMILKVILGPDLAILENYYAFVNTTGSSADLQKIMELKGLKRAEMQVYLDKYNKDPSTQTQGKKVNFLDRFMPHFD